MQNPSTHESMLNAYLITPAAVQAHQYILSGKSNDAIRLCQLELRSQPDSAVLWFWLASAQHQLGHLDAALSGFDRSLSLHMTPLALSAKATLLSQLQRYQESLAVAQAALDISPEAPLLIANVAVALERLNRLEEALAHYDHSLAIDPSQQTALINRAGVLAVLGRLEEGLAQNYRAMEALPHVPDVYRNCANALIALFRYAEAIEVCRQGLDLHPDHAQLKFQTGLCLSALGSFEGARVELAEAQVMNPGVIASFLQRFRHEKLPNNLHLNPMLLYLDARYQEQMHCYWQYRDTYIDMLNESIHGWETAGAVISNLEFGFQSFSLNINASNRLRLAKNMGDFILDSAWNLNLPPFKFDRLKLANRQDKRLRIGYLSADFRRHPTGYLTRQIYGLHDRERFEVYAYSLIDIDADDPVHQSIRAGSDVFHDVTKLDSPALAKLIYQDEIDILIDLGGYTTFARPEVVALRPAPVQFNYVGYVESLGHGLVDYVITDVHVYPEGKTSYWHEAPIRMPHHVLPYDDQTCNSPTEASRADYGLPEDAFVFCCLNNSYKIEPEVFDVWANILMAVPNSVLWIYEKNALTRMNILREAEARGIAPERLVFAKFLDSIREHILRYQLADIFLDTLWHNAHTTALEALWQGLPVLTYEGDVVSARLAASCLHVLNLPELIMHNMDDYEERAIFYAQHPSELAVLKEKLKEARYASGLFNSALAVKHLEYAYDTAWQRYIQGLLPEGFDVPDLSSARE